MIVTIQAPSSSERVAGIWEAGMLMGLEVEKHEGNTFDVVVHDQGKLDKILSKCNGRVIATKHSSMC
jgi:hypothetical protein